MRYKHFLKLEKNIQGFSLPELVVTIAIITIVTGVVLFKYADFNSTVLLKSQAYEVALDIRETQVFGVSVKAEGANSFREEYGLNFNTNTRPNSYIFFQDSGSQVPARYNNGEQVGGSILLDPRYMISSICVNTPDCATELGDVSITFKRPNFDVSFWSSEVSSIDTLFINISPITDATIQRTVSIYESGQISAE